MIYVDLPDHSPRPLPFYLAMEEHLASTGSEADMFFMWQVDPTVICGRNQEIPLEVDLAYCEANTIDVVRRRSGGGCVFADRSNIMFSYITPTADVTTTFAAYTGMVARTLRGLGLDATATSRNDVLIGGRKVSGNAFYRLPTHSIVHGTMLYDIDPVHMSRAITPSRAKLASKGVTSVSSRVTTIRQHSDITLPYFMAYCRKALCGDRSITLTPRDVDLIEERALSYRRPEWFGRIRQADRRSTRIEGVGEIRTSVQLAPDGTIDRISLAGDFLTPLTDIDSLLGRLRGVRPDRQSLAAALSGCRAGDYLAGLTNQRLIEILTT